MMDEKKRATMSTQAGKTQAINTPLGTNNLVSSRNDLFLMCKYC
jgi:hypothetical protein